MFSLLKGIQAIRDHHAIAYFADNRKVKVVVEEDQKWIMETWLPLAIEAGPKRIAVVTAPSGLRKLTVEDVVGRVDHLGLVSRSFESVEEARNWISKAEMASVTVEQL